MKQVKIENLTHNQISGVTVMLPGDETVYKEKFFEWRASFYAVVVETRMDAPRMLLPEGVSGI